MLHEHLVHCGFAASDGEAGDGAADAADDGVGAVGRAKIKRLVHFARCCSVDRS